jgi:hypothetical protein
MVQSNVMVSGSALINSGVQGNFIYQRFISSSKLKTEVLYPPIEMLHVDGSKNSGGNVDEHTWFKAIMKDQAYWMQFYVMNLGSDHILGDPWLWAVSLQIGWP